MTTIHAAAVETLAADFAGQLIQPKDPDYDTARQIWNGHLQRRPALIARCRGVADVMAAVRFCRQQELPASVRGGAHAVAGHAVCDGGVVIDLTAMTGSRVDLLAAPSTSTAAAGTRIWTGRARHSGSPPPEELSATPASVA
jgi:FAD/FMN-containing dehydrogenase